MILFQPEVSTQHVPFCRSSDLFQRNMWPTMWQRDGWHLQNSWIFGKVPNGLWLVTVRNVYPKIAYPSYTGYFDFSFHVSMALWCKYTRISLIWKSHCKLFQFHAQIGPKSAVNFCIENDSPTRGTFPKIHPFSRRHPSQRKKASCDQYLPFPWERQKRQGAVQSEHENGISNLRKQDWQNLGNIFG